MEYPSVHIDNAIRISSPFDARQMFISEKCEIIHLVLQPGEKMELHIQPFDVVFYILSGEGLLRTSTFSVSFGGNTCIPVKAGIERAWENNAETAFCALVIKLLS